MLCLFRRISRRIATGARLPVRPSLRLSPCRQSGFAAPFLFQLFACLLVVAASAPPLRAQESQRAEFRAFWVDTFNTALNNHADVVAVVNNAKAVKANAIFAQVRRRGDSWYLNSLEPAPDFIPLAAGFDPLQDLIDTAHSEGIEVHAFVIMSAVWSKNPTFAPSSTLGPPVSNDHVFNKHGWNKATSSMRTGNDNWLTRSRSPFPAGVTFDGQRYGSDFWLDFGHPDAAAYTVDVLMHLVRNYEIDGLHLDRIRYPEFSVATGQPALTPANGANIGYNQVSVERFQRRHGISAGSPPPAQNDALWSQWRRDQVTNLVRRVYLNAIAEKPHLKVSAALIAFGNGPVCPSGGNCKAIWESSIRAEAYWRVYQDWRAWTEEGIIDIAAPMDYKREHITAQATQFNEWIEWTKNNQYNRSAMIGLGSFVNSVEGTVRQVRRSLAPSAQGNSANGVIFFSMAVSNVFSNNGAVTPVAVANPFSVPPGQLTPTRSYAEFAAGLTTGKSVNGATLYEPDAGDAGYTAIFSQQATIPVLPWKSAPTKGHLMGLARRPDATPLDTATVTIENLQTGTTRTTATDGNGFFGGVDLEPGQYLVRAELGTDKLYTCVAQVSAGSVTPADAGVETIAPVTTVALQPAAPDGENNWYRTDVTVGLAASDNCSGVARTEYSLDGGATWQSYTGEFSISSEGTTTVLYRSSDRAENTETAQSLSIMIDKTAPSIQLSADPAIIWPPNGKMVPVTLSGAGSDAVSGLASVSYSVTDEYGTPLGISPRALSGNSAIWTETLALEARREGEDLDGRRYLITATIRDAAGHTSTATAEVLVPHDQRNK
jgi:uncharacterized lipoprotein YddW (UPF0748 family)